MTVVACHCPPVALLILRRFNCVAASAKGIAIRHRRAMGDAF
jgi:hypothetical protein